MVQQKCEAARGDKDAAETTWVTELSLPDAPLKPTASGTWPAVKPSDCQGMVKKHSCNSVGMGLKVRWWLCMGVL